MSFDLRIPAVPLLALLLAFPMVAVAHIRGFTNQDIRQRLEHSPLLGPKRQTPQQRSARVSRLFRRLHLYGLIGKVPRSRRWRLTNNGLRVVASAIRLREQTFPTLYATAYA